MRSDIGDARELVHEGRFSDLGCVMLGRNQLETLIDDRNLDVDKLGYLISHRDSFLPIRYGVTFYVEPHSPHQFSRQFRFCHKIPKVLLEDPRTREVSYENALLYCKRLIFLGTTSQGILPYHSLALSHRISSAYRILWFK